MNSVPLAFEPNVGQAEAQTRFIIHRPDISAGFASDAITLRLPQKGAAAAHMGISFGRSAQIIGEQELPGKTNYFRGNNPAAWRTGIATFGRIRYNQLWPGTDVVFYGNGERLEHDFVLAPGADPRRISFELQEAQSIEIDHDGDLLVHLGDALVTFKKPVAYQETASGREQVIANFKLNGTRVGFHVGRYDHRRPLIIDPVLVFSTDLAGSAFETIQGLAVDAQNNIYVTGGTSSTDFPTTVGSFQPACACCSPSNDAFVTKLNPTGTALVYSTFLGGTSDDLAQSIAIDSNGNAIVAGLTSSPDFPAVNPIGTFSGATGTAHLFISSLSPTGAALNYSGVVGPLTPPFSFTTSTPLTSTAPPLALDSSGNAYVTTQTLFDTFPTTPSAIAPVPPNPQVGILLALKVSPTGSLVYSTAIPGRAAAGTGSPPPNSFFPKAIAVDSTGSAYIAGQANDGLPTTLGVIGSAFSSDSGPGVFFPQEGFLLKLNPTGSALSYATYIPGTSRVTTMRL
ncbi:MAG TPA: SBBP repeat-containing protein, partial [Candidatus Angelobacter sp.]|nr:SBBP repeat-containing protein [Candidatus Angelobacter sp.]